MTTSAADLGAFARDSKWLEYLRAVYTPEPIPPCSVCGAPLGIASIGGSSATVWACHEADPITTGDWDHYRQSRYTERLHGDTKVVALLDLIDSDPDLRARAEAALLDWETKDV